MLTKIHRHNIANKKWRLANPNYFRKWRLLNPNYKPPHYSLTYESWVKMKSRCYNPKCRQWKWYGGKGIKVCQAWFWFPYFLEDMGKRPSIKYSIDRIDSTKNYEPSNCRWILKSENTRRMYHSAH